MTTRQTVLIIDASPLIYATFASVGHFSTQAGEPTGLRYGFLRSVKSYAEKTKADKVVIAFDLPGQIEKAKDRQEYKANRDWTPEKATMYAQVPALRELLADTWFTQADAEGFEADDVIATIARPLAAQANTVLVVTTDNDLCQLISPRIKIWMPPKKKDKAWMKDDDWVRENFRVPAKNLLVWRAIVGDESDHLAPATTNRASQVTIEDYLNRNETGSELATDVTDLCPHFLGFLKTVLTSEAMDMFARNLTCMALHDARPRLNLTKGRRDQEVLLKTFHRLEMKSMLAHASYYAGEHEELI